jgi:hypothetical protein
MFIIPAVKERRKAAAAAKADGGPEAETKLAQFKGKVKGFLLRVYELLPKYSQIRDCIHEQRRTVPGRL